MLEAWTRIIRLLANNVKVALEMFIPGFGIVLGTFSAFSTGLVFNALSGILPALSNLSPLIVFLTPFGILELIAYGITISRSGISYQLIKDINRRIISKFITYLSYSLIIITLDINHYKLDVPNYDNTTYYLNSNNLVVNRRCSEQYGRYSELSSRMLN